MNLISTYTETSENLKVGMRLHHFAYPQGCQITRVGPYRGKYAEDFLNTIVYTTPTRTIEMANPRGGHHRVMCGDFKGM